VTVNSVHTRRRGPGTKMGRASGSGLSVRCRARPWSSIHTCQIRKTRRCCFTASTPTRSSKRRSNDSARRYEMFERGSTPHRAAQAIQSTTSSLLLATCEWASLVLSGTAELRSSWRRARRAGRHNVATSCGSKTGRDRQASSASRLSPGREERASSATSHRARRVLRTSPGSSRPGSGSRRWCRSSERA
jgi:hypothetical protein